MKGIYRMKLNRKGQFYLILMSSNGKILFTTESFTQKPSAWTNVKSTLKTLNGKSVLVQDDTLQSDPVVYKVTPTLVKATTQKPRK